MGDGDEDDDEDGSNLLGLKRHQSGFPQESAGSGWCCHKQIESLVNEQHLVLINSMLVLMKIRMVLLMKRVVCKRRRHPSREMPPYAARSPANHQHPCHYTGTRHTNNYPTWCSERMIMTRLPHAITLPWHFPFRPPSSMTVGHIIKASLLLPKAR